MRSRGLAPATVEPAIVNVSVIDSTEALGLLRKDWDQLLAVSSNGSIFSTWEWATAWWKSYGRGKSLWILKISRDGHLIGLAPFYLENIRRFGALTYRTLRLVGDGSADSDYLEVISASGEEESVARSIVTHLLGHKSIWDIALLNEIPETSLTLRFLRTVFQENDCYWNETARPCSYVNLPADWNTYLLGLRPRMRTKIRSLSRELEKKFTVNFNVCQSLTELDAGLESLFRLHGKRWEIRGQDGVFASPSKRHFYQELSPLLLNRRWLRFYTLALNNGAVAHQYCFEYRNKMFLLQEGFDPEWDQYGVGNVLRSYVFRDCIERKLAAYDFLGGITEHKTSWGAVQKFSLSTAALTPGMKNKLFLSLPKAIATGKDRIRAILPEAVLRWRETWLKKNSSPDGIESRTDTRGQGVTRSHAKSDT